MLCWLMVANCSVAGFWWKCTTKSKNINNDRDLNVNLNHANKYHFIYWCIYLCICLFILQKHDEPDSQRPEGSTVKVPVLNHSKLTQLLSESCSFWLMINRVSHSGQHKRIYYLLCHLKCPFSWGKSLLLPAGFDIIQIRQVSGISGSYSIVSGLVETVESHSDAVIWDDVVMNNGARISPTLTWKENKVIKMSLNTTHVFTTLYFTGFLASEMISAAVWEKCREKKQTYNLHCLLRLYFLSWTQKQS